VICENITQGFSPFDADIAFDRCQHVGKTGFYMPDILVDILLIWERVERQLGRVFGWITTQLFDDVSQLGVAQGYGLKLASAVP
jgi:hypothetical protein